MGKVSKVCMCSAHHVAVGPTSCILAGSRGCFGMQQCVYLVDCFSISLAVHNRSLVQDCRVLENGSMPTGSPFCCNNS